MKKILISLLVVGVVSFAAVKATGAFFSDTENSTNNKFTAGTLSVKVLDQNGDTEFASENLKSNWQPGEEVLVNFDVKNDGNVPVQLRGFATGTWNNPDLDVQNKVKVTKVERFNGAWQEVMSNSAGITGFFYYALNGLDLGPFYDLAPGDRAQLQLTVKLDETAGNDFQTGVFTSNIQVQARQTTVGATWP